MSFPSKARLCCFRGLLAALLLLPVYGCAEEPEEVIVIPLPEGTELAAKIGWYLGNRHIPVEVREGEIVVEVFPTLTDSLERIGIGYEERSDVLRCGPHSSGHRH